MKENHLLKITEIEKLIEPQGGCVVSNKITLDGEPISFIYKDYPDDGMDSGWRILTGSESEDYLDNPGNSGVYDLNTVANYDKTIIPYLELPIQTSLIRNENKDSSSEEFIPLKD